MLTLGLITIIQDFLPLNLGSTDVILGVQWLAILGDVTSNHLNLKMCFVLGKSSIVLQGDPTLVRSQVTLKSLITSLKLEKQGFLVELNVLQESEPKTTDEWDDILEIIRSVLTQHASVFQPLPCLPSAREGDHSIELISGTALVNVCPYRYPQFQKNEIEKLVEEMLAAGIIQPNNSAFSRPGLLVKKKDGSWRFCLDYRALNKVTIPDKFLIPMVDELLDELHEVVIFSKIDLKSGYHQICLKKEIVPKSAFITHQGDYEFLVMTFGLTNAPSTFQALMNKVLRPYFV